LRNVLPNPLLAVEAPPAAIKSPQRLIA